MSRTSKIIVVIISAIILLIVGGLYFLKSFFSAFAPPKVTVTREYISSSHGLINGVDIEKIQVDSIGGNDLPVKYTTVYRVSCGSADAARKSPNKINFFKPNDDYFWSEDTTKVRYTHISLSRQSLDTTNKLWWTREFGKQPVCPLRFETGQWYLITIGDPRVTGIFFYIDSSGKEHQYFLASGVSPI